MLPSSSKHCKHLTHWHQTASVPPAGRVIRGHRPCSSEGPSPTTESATDPKAALLARINKAKQYKKDGALPSPQPESAPSPTTEPPSGFLKRPPPTDWGAVASFIDSGGKSGSQEDDGPPMPTSSSPQTQEQQQAEEALLAGLRERFKAASDKSDQPSPSDSDSAITRLLLNATQAPSRGSANQAAAALQAALREDLDSIDTSNMRMEEITMMRETRLRQLGAEILTVDSTYRAGGEGPNDVIVSTTRNAEAAAQLLGLQPEQLLQELRKAAQPSTSAAAAPAPAEGEDGAASSGEEYNPKVSTWGVFPRPKDISKAYGGGRELKPGQELETKEQRAARDAAYAQALESYKARTGLQVDEEDEERAQVLYDEGMALVGKARLQDAYNKFQQVLDIVPIKSKFGGMAGLQSAIILDSQGPEYEEQAKQLYRRLQGHAVAAVSRKAKQMLFGFQAAQFLKAETMSYAVKNRDYEGYFRPLADRNKIWVPTEAERLQDERSARLASLIAVAVLVGPVAIMGTLIAQYGPHM